MHCARSIPGVFLDLRGTGGAGEGGAGLPDTWPMDQVDAQRRRIQK
jgi:hypothetical protein